MRLGGTRMATVKERNAQDATRLRDLDPLREKIKVLQTEMKALKRALKKLGVTV